MPLSGVCCDSVTSSRLFCLWRRGRRMECCPVTDDRLPFAVHFPCACAPEMGRWIRLFHGAETGFALASLVDLHLLSSKQQHFEHQHIHTVLRTPPVEINSDPTSFSSIVKFDAPIAAFVRAHPHPSELRGPLLFGPVLTWPALFPEGLGGLQFSPSPPTATLAHLGDCGVFHFDPDSRSSISIPVAPFYSPQRSNHTKPDATLPVTPCATPNLWYLLDPFPLPFPWHRLEKSDIEPSTPDSPLAQDERPTHLAKPSLADQADDYLQPTSSLPKTATADRSRRNSRQFIFYHLTSHRCLCDAIPAKSCAALWRHCEHEF